MWWGSSQRLSRSWALSEIQVWSDLLWLFIVLSFSLMPLCCDHCVTFESLNRIIQVCGASSWTPWPISGGVSCQSIERWASHFSRPLVPGKIKHPSHWVLLCFFYTPYSRCFTLSFPLPLSLPPSLCLYSDNVIDGLLTLTMQVYCSVSPASLCIAFSHLVLLAPSTPRVSSLVLCCHESLLGRD